jgi:alkylhydroperoxidase family enzyme
MRLASVFSVRLGKLLGRSAPAPVSAAHALPGYLALSRLSGRSRVLDERLSLLAGNLAADLSGCRWCIDRSRHECRCAGLPRVVVDRPRSYSGEALISSRERAALSFVETIACHHASAGRIDDLVLQQARCFLSEIELAELTAIVAEYHFLAHDVSSHSSQS